MTESVPLLAPFLELDRTGSRSRHVLDDDRPVEAGTVLELQLANGGWLPLRYEAR